MTSPPAGVLRSKAPFSVRLAALCCAAGALRLLGPAWLLVGAGQRRPVPKPPPGGAAAPAAPAAKAEAEWGLFLPLVEVLVVEITVALHSRVRQQPGEGGDDMSPDGSEKPPPEPKPPPPRQTQGDGGLGEEAAASAAALPVCLELYEGAVEALAASQQEEEEAEEEEHAKQGGAAAAAGAKPRKFPRVPAEVAERALGALTRLAETLCAFLEWELHERHNRSLDSEGAAVARALGCLLAEVPGAAPDGFKKVLAGLMTAEVPASSSPGGGGGGEGGEGNGAAAKSPALLFLLPALVQMTDTADSPADLCDAFVEAGGCGALAGYLQRAAAEGAEEGPVQAACGVARNVLQRAVLAEARALRFPSPGATCSH